MAEPIEVRSHARASAGRPVDGIGEIARTASSQIVEHASSVRETAKGKVEKLTAKKSDPYESAIVEYNRAFTEMNDKGLSLLRQRERSTDLVGLVELLVNRIANTPKSFGTDFDEIDVHKAQFLEAEEFARKDLDAARKSAAGAGAGLTAGAAVASMAPSAAMWVDSCGRPAVYLAL